MPRGVKGPVVEFMKVGNIQILRPDQYNWEVTGDGRSTYHVSLALAITAAAHRSSEKKARNASEWLAQYQKITAVLFKAAEQLQKNQ